MLSAVKGGLIVSCQAQPEEPLHSPMIMARVALAAKIGGAVGIRSSSAVDIKAIKEIIDLPIIGLIKRDYEDSDIYITATKTEVLELIESGCEMIALDGTLRKRPHDEDLESLVELIHQQGILAMADISTYDEAINAQDIGFDCVSTTLSGYTPYSPQLKGPDFKLVKKLVKKLQIPVIAEGRISQVKEIQKIHAYGPHSIVVGSAISRPQLITKMYVDAISNK